MARKITRSGSWHGQDAAVLAGNRRDGYVILVGGFSVKETAKVRKMVRDDKPLGEYRDYVLFVEADEWAQQQ